MEEAYKLIIKYRGNKVFSKDPTLEYKIQEPLIKFADGSLISIETGKILTQGPRLQDGTIRLEISSSVNRTDVSMAFHNLSGKVFGEKK